jgi:hypothetical protein
MARRTALYVSLASLALAACGREGPAPDFTVRGTGVVVRTDAAFAASADFPARVESTLDAALAYWGGDWGRLDGVTVTFEGAPSVECGGAHGAIGCYDGDIRVTTRDPSVELTCVEQTALVHEVGHAVIGDPDHRDPRWMDFRALADDLSGRTGYSWSGAAGCPIYRSIWVHPPRH